MAVRAEYIQRFLAQRGYDLKIVAYDLNYYDQVDLWAEVQNKQLSGGIFVALPCESSKRQLQELERRNFPHVRLGNNCFADELAAPLVKGNDAGRTRKALEHLWRCGHRKIGLIPYTVSGETDTAYVRFYKGKEHQARWFMYLGFYGSREQYQSFPGKQLAAGYLGHNPDVTAILVEHVSFCKDLMKQAQCMGREIPADLSVLALNDWPGLEMFSPPVTAMRLSPQAEAEKACEMLLKVISGKLRPEEKLVLVDYDFIERESVAPVQEPALV